MEVGCLESNLSTLWLFLCQTNVDLESLLRVRFGIGRERPVSMGTAAVSNSNVCVAAHAPMIDRKQGLLASRVMDLHAAIAVKWLTHAVAKVINGTRCTRDIC